MSYETLRLEVADGVARVTLTQPERGNPIDGPLCAGLNALSVELASRRDVRAVLLTAEGRAFSFGGDVAVFADAGDELPALIRTWTADVHMAIARLQRIDAPIVAAVHGVCAGGMAAFVAGADLVIGGDDLRVVAAYTGIGYSCDAGASAMLARRLGPARARRYLLLGETLDATAALDAGFADEIVPAAELADRATAHAVRLAQGPTRAFGEIRRLLLTVGHQPLESQLEDEAQALARIASSADAAEGLRAFADKRRPAFEGR